MASVNMLPEEHATGRVEKIYDDIKAELGIDFVPMTFRSLPVWFFP